MVQIAIPYAYTVVPYPYTHTVHTIRVRYKLRVWYTTATPRDLTIHHVDACEKSLHNGNW